MSKILVLVGSVTTAVRFEKILRKKMRVASVVVHTPTELGGGGCSYSVKTDINNLSYVKEIAREYGISLRGIYVDKEVEGESRYHVISG